MRINASLKWCLVLDSNAVSKTIWKRIPHLHGENFWLWTSQLVHTLRRRGAKIHARTRAWNLKDTQREGSAEKKNHPNLIFRRQRVRSYHTLSQIIRKQWKHEWGRIHWKEHSRSSSVDDNNLNMFSNKTHYDFLKKLIKEACLAPLFLISTCVFLLVFLAGDGGRSFNGCSVVTNCTSLSLASVESLSQSFSVTIKGKNRKVNTFTTTQNFPVCITTRDNLEPAY